MLGPLLLYSLRSVSEAVEIVRNWWQTQPAGIASSFWQQPTLPVTLNRSFNLRKRVRYSTQILATNERVNCESYLLLFWFTKYPISTFTLVVRQTRPRYNLDGRFSLVTSGFLGNRLCFLQGAISSLSYYTKLLNEVLNFIKFVFLLDAVFFFFFITYLFALQQDSLAMFH